MWIICWKHCLGCSIKSFLSLVAVHHHLVAYPQGCIYHQDIKAIELEAQLKSLKTYFDKKEDTSLADIIEKIRKLPKSSKVYFSQVTTLLKISLVLLATNADSVRSASTLRRIKNWLRTSMTQRRLNHCMLLAIYKDGKLSLIDVAASEFCFGSDERSLLFSHFC